MFPDTKEKKKASLGPTRKRSSDYSSDITIHGAYLVTQIESGLGRIGSPISQPREVMLLSEVKQQGIMETAKKLTLWEAIRWKNSGGNVKAVVCKESEGSEGEDMWINFWIDVLSDDVSPSEREKWTGYERMIQRYTQARNLTPGVVFLREIAIQDLTNVAGPKKDTSKQDPIFDPQGKEGCAIGIVSTILNILPGGSCINILHTRDGRPADICLSIGIDYDEENIRLSDGRTPGCTVSRISKERDELVVEFSEKLISLVSEKGCQIEIIDPPRPVNP